MCLSKGGALWCLEKLEEEGWGVKRRKTGEEGGQEGSMGGDKYSTAPQKELVLGHSTSSLLCVLSVPESRWNVSAQGGGSSLVLSN